MNTVVLTCCCAMISPKPAQHRQGLVLFNPAPACVIMILIMSESDHKSASQPCHLANGDSATQENHQMIRHFNVGMREYFEAGRCGPGHVVDVFNMTDALVSNEDMASEAPALTHDGVHWSEVVNLLKVRLDRRMCVEADQTTCKCWTGGGGGHKRAVVTLVNHVRVKRGTQNTPAVPLQHAALFSTRDWGARLTCCA